MINNHKYQGTRRAFLGLIGAVTLAISSGCLTPRQQNAGGYILEQDIRVTRGLNPGAAAAGLIVAGLMQSDAPLRNTQYQNAPESPFGACNLNTPEGMYKLREFYKSCIVSECKKEKIKMTREEIEREIDMRMRRHIGASYERKLYGDYVEMGSTMPKKK